MREDMTRDARTVVVVFGLVFGLMASAVGRGVGQSVEELRARAEEGDADAEFRLGGMYAQESGPVVRDLVEAGRWLRRAAEQGHEQDDLLDMAFSRDRTQERKAWITEAMATRTCCEQSDRQDKIRSAEISKAR